MERPMSDDRLTSSWAVQLIPIFGVLYLFYSLSPWLWFSHSFVNNRKGFEILWTNAMIRFKENGKGIMAEAFAKYGNAFYVMTDYGIHLALSPKYANEIRNDPRLSPDMYNAEMLNGHLYGFEGVRIDSVEMKFFHDMIQNRLTPMLGKLLAPLVVEAEDAIRKHWTDSTEWHEVKLYNSAGAISKQVSGRAFAGEELCRHPGWLEGCEQYTRDIFAAGATVRMFPGFIRPLVARFVPQCHVLHERLDSIAKMIQTVIDKRRADREASVSQGKDPKEHLDLLQDMEAFSNSSAKDMAVLQLKGVLASVNAVQEIMAQTVFNICANPELIPSLREEIITNIGAEGWKRTSFHKLQLLDSVMKETLRMKPGTMAPMSRGALESITLSDGLKIPKGTLVNLMCHNMWDEDVYPNANQFDGYRFYRLRQHAETRNQAHLVSATPDYLGFGLGKHSCPGRFFAETTIKFVVAHLLLKYDMRLVDGIEPRVEHIGNAILADSSAPIAIRRRKEEIALDINMSDQL
nr:cytochrome P450 monooxygenase BrvD [Penicillium bialowiezense]